MLPEPFHLLPPNARRTYHLATGQAAFHLDEKTRGLFFIKHGKIELRRVTQAGHSVIIHRAQQGETFAEASLFSSHYHCDAIATSNCHLVELDRAIIINMLKNDAQFSLAMARRFALQNQGYRRKLELLAIKSAPERILVAVIDGLLVENIKTFAAEIGLAHEVVYRGLAQLVRQGRLEKIGRGKYQSIR